MIRRLFLCFGDDSELEDGALDAWKALSIRYASNSYSN